MDTEIKLIKEALEFYEQASLICGIIVFSPIAVALACKAFQAAKQPTLTAYLDFRFGRSRALDPRESELITMSDAAKLC